MNLREEMVLPPNRRIMAHSHNDKKEDKVFLKYKEIQMGAVAKSYMKKGFRMRKYANI
jgi:hypothetical protein